MKSTMNDVLVPLCERYGMNLQTGAGELSITAALNMVRRIEEVGKPTRIFYLSDFDPAGQSMPVAMARKLEYFVRTRQVQHDIRLFPLVLSAGQVQEYQLPRTPIKESERRRSSFEQRYGPGATELDALEAIAPGILARLVTEAVERYYDVDLRWRAMEMELELERELVQRHAEVLGGYAGQHESLR